jgi:hypothetical protein
MTCARQASKNSVQNFGAKNSPVVVSPQISLGAEGCGLVFDPDAVTNVIKLFSPLSLPVHCGKPEYLSVFMLR